VKKILDVIKAQRRENFDTKVLDAMVESVRSTVKGVNNEERNGQGGAIELHKDEEPLLKAIQTLELHHLPGVPYSVSDREAVASRYIAWDYDLEVPQPQRPVVSDSGSAQSTRGVMPFIDWLLLQAIEDGKCDVEYLKALRDLYLTQVQLREGAAITERSPPLPTMQTLEMELPLPMRNAVSQI